MATEPTVIDDKAPVPEFPRSGTSKNGNDTGWAVEARSTLSLPKQFGPLLLNDQWQQVPFNKQVPGGPPGVPVSMHFEGADMGLLTYEAAQALRWWFLADLAAAYSEHGIETRLVRYEVVYSKKTVAVAAGEVVDDRYKLNAFK